PSVARFSGVTRPAYASSFPTRRSSDLMVTVKGPKGELTREFSDKISMKIEGDVVSFERSADDYKTKSLHGTTRANFNNMVIGVTDRKSTRLNSSHVSI